MEDKKENTIYMDNFHSFAYHTSFYSSQAGTDILNNNGTRKHLYFKEAPTSQKNNSFLEKLSETKSVADETVSWHEFTQNTTFHGIRYIFKSSYKLRKILWIACVLLAVLCFAVQVGQRTSDYFKYETNVDVEVLYVEELQFPAVTLCNQNNFRTTVMTNNRLYYFIDDIYSARNISQVDLSEYDVTGIDTVDFITSAAHQLHDLIDECTWSQKPCDLERDFIRTITDMGVCYTFNSGSNSRSVTDYGSAYGLKLTLNVEQYEYMKGPNNDAGVKILLHEPNEYPLMKDKGFAVEPGTHTLVGIWNLEVNTMAPPYGSCDESMGRSGRSHCLRDCQQDTVIERCGCVDVFMNNKTHPTCELRELFQCARDTSINNDRKCNCGVPCKQLKYEPSFSYAQLSQFNVERIVLTDDERREAVEQRFALALELSQRVDPEIVQADREQLAQMLEYVTTLEHVISNTYEGLASEQNFHDIFDIPLPIIDGDYFFSTEREDVVKIRNTIFREVYNFLFYELDYIPYYAYIGRYSDTAIMPNMTKSVHSMLYDILTTYNATSSLTHRLYTCDVTATSNSDYANSNYNHSYYNNQRENSSDWSIVHTVCQFEACAQMNVVDYEMNCDVIFESTKFKARNMVNSLEQSLQTENFALRIKQLYENLLDDIYNETFVTYDQIPEHQQCLDYLDEAMIFKSAMYDVKDTLETFANSSSIDEMKTNAESLLQALNTTLINKYYTMSAETVKSKCCWLSEYIGHSLDGQCYQDEYNPDLDCPKFSNFINNIDNMQRTYKLFQIGFINLGRYISDMHTAMRSRIGPVLTSSIIQYLDMNITKMDLAHRMESLIGRQSLQDIVRDGADFVSTALESVRDAELIMVNLQDAYENVLRIVVPVYNMSHFRHTRFMRFVQSHNTSQTNEILEDLETNVTETMRQLFQHLFMGYVDVVTQARSHLKNSLDALEEAADILDEDLQKYMLLGRMDDQFYMRNFLQADIFYKELSYEKISQQPSFGFPSLLSEVGGFLGLLLGASILTVCELLDYIAMELFMRCRGRQSFQAKA